MKNIFLFLVVFCPFLGKLTAQDITQVRILNAKVGETMSWYTNFRAKIYTFPKNDPIYKVTGDSLQRVNTGKKQ